jgi:hypothetical protein
MIFHLIYLISLCRTLFIYVMISRIRNLTWQAYSLCAACVLNIKVKYEKKVIKIVKNRSECRTLRVIFCHFRETIHICHYRILYHALDLLPYYLRIPRLKRPTALIKPSNQTHHTHINTHTSHTHTHI